MKVQLRQGKDKLTTNFEQLLKTNPTIKNAEIKKQPEHGNPPKKNRKLEMLSHYLQSCVEKGIKKQIQSGHQEIK